MISMPGKRLKDDLCYRDLHRIDINDLAGRVVSQSPRHQGTSTATAAPAESHILFDEPWKRRARAFYRFIRADHPFLSSNTRHLKTCIRCTDSTRLHVGCLCMQWTYMHTLQLLRLSQ